jgi:hypothetical protein
MVCEPMAATRNKYFRSMYGIVAIVVVSLVFSELASRFNQQSITNLSFDGKYDDASWYYEDDYPDELDPSAASTHIGMFMAWALLSDLGSKDFADEPELLKKLRDRTITPGQFVIEFNDEKLTDECFNDKGNAFAKFYYWPSDVDKYRSDYLQTLAVGLPTPFHVEDTWENFDRISKVIGQRFAQWERVHWPRA